MSKALQQAAKVNQEGADFLEVGQTSKALKCFRAGLKLINASCQQSLFESLPKRGLAALKASTPVRLSPVVSSAENGNQNKDFYSQVFHFDPQGKVSVQKQSYCSAVLIFNCALALHQKGYRESENEGTYKSYTKALLFYSQAFSLLRPFSDTPECFQVIHEIMKNQADIYYKINDLGSVKRVLEELVHLTKESQSAPEERPKSNVAISA